MSARLAADAVTFAFGERTVVADVDLALAPGELVAVLGPNGSGKSTLLRLLAGLAVPRAGAVRLDGRDLRTLDRRTVARRLALVPQDPRVDYPFTALEVTLMGRAPHQRGLGLPSPRDLAIAEQALRCVDAASLAARPLDRLSGGERQRVFLARALAQQPEVLLLDEPVTHLDVRHQLDVHALLCRLCRERQLACVTVVHDLNLALSYCDRALVLSAGRVAAQGPPAVALDAACVAAVFGVQMLTVAHPQTGAPVLVAAENAADPFARPGGA
ncbi:MAG TPA: ABC transporter ATP-binding protein [Candidatus Limnocylindria bacterium]|nr:ABC transporter ATP-binding protein [Candidatus Limnocylindria bacterium]